MNDIEEGNRIIAEYTGSKPIKHSRYNYRIWEGGFPFVDKKLCQSNNLLFHSNWTWLMAAISKLVENGITFSSDIMPNTFNFTFSQGNKRLVRFDGSRTLYKMYLWEGVVEAIKKLEDDKSN